MDKLWRAPVLGFLHECRGWGSSPQLAHTAKAWKSLLITHYPVPGELRPPEQKKAGLRVTASPRYPYDERESVFSCLGRGLGARRAGTRWAGWDLRSFGHVAQFEIGKSVCCIADAGRILPSVPMAACPGIVRLHNLVPTSTLGYTGQNTILATVGRCLCVPRFGAFFSDK